jgi:hypothetical protein
MSNDTHDTQKAPNVQPNIEKPAVFPTFGKFTGSRDALQANIADTGAFVLLLLLDITKMVLQLMKQPM